MLCQACVIYLKILQKNTPEILDIWEKKSQRGMGIKSMGACFTMYVNIFSNLQPLFQTDRLLESQEYLGQLISSWTQLLRSNTV